MFPSKGKDTGKKFGCHKCSGVSQVNHFLNRLIFYIKNFFGKSYANGKEKHEKLAQLVLAECKLISLCVLGEKEILGQPKPHLEQDVCHALRTPRGG